MSKFEKDAVRREGAAAFKARLLSAIDNIFTSELGNEEGSGYVLGPAFKPDTEDNMLALRAWIESFGP
jgi:hypothetical protein